MIKRANQVVTSPGGSGSSVSSRPNYSSPTPAGPSNAPSGTPVSVPSGSGGGGWSGGGGGGQQYYGGSPSYDGGQIQEEVVIEEPTPVRRDDQTDQAPEREEQQSKEQQEQREIANREAPEQEQPQQQQDGRPAGFVRPRTLMTAAPSDSMPDQQDQSASEQEAMELNNQLNNQLASEPSTPSTQPRRQSQRSQSEQQQHEQTLRQQTASTPVIEFLDTRQATRSEQNDEELTIMSPEPRQIAPADNPDRPLVSQHKVDARQAEDKQNARRQAKAKGLGNGVNLELTGDYNLNINEVSIGARSIQQAMSTEGGAILSLIQKYAPDVDVVLLKTNEDYAYQALNDMTMNNDIELLTIKHPTPGTGDFAVRRLMVHPGNNIKIHPNMLKMSNADADGDEMQVSFNENDTAGIRSVVDLLIDLNNKASLDASVVGMYTWYQQGDDPHSTINSILRNQIPTFAALTNEETSSIARQLASVMDGNEDAYRDLLQAIQIAARSHSANNREYVYLASNLLKSIFDYNRYFFDASMITDSSSYTDTIYQLDDVETAEELNEDLMSGTAPANMMDLASAESWPTAFVPKKNPHFRMASAIGKIVNTTRRLLIGNERFKNGPLARRFDNANEIVSRQMSGLAGLRDYEFNVVTWTRLHIIREVGAPSDVRYNGDINAFIDAFYSSFNKFNYIATISNQNILSQYSGARDNDRWSYHELESKSPDDIASAFKSVYGEFDMQTLFANVATPRMLDSFRNMTVNDFVMNSRSTLYVRRAGDEESTNVQDFIQALATVRTSQYRTFSNSFDQLADKMIDDGQTKLKKAMGESNVVDYVDKQVEALSDAMYMLGPDAFSRYRMENIEQMKANELGNAIINASSKEELKSLVYELHARYKMQDVYDLQRAERIEEMDAELDCLAKSSDTWRMLVSDIRQNGALLREILNDSNFMENGHIRSNRVLRNSEGSNAWQRLASSYKSGNAVENILMNRDFTATEKEAMINDLQKYQPDGNVKQQMFEIPLDIMRESAQKSPGPNATTDFSRGRLLDNFKTADRYMDRGAKEAYKNIVQEVNKARQYFAENGNKSALSDYLRNIADGTHTLFAVNRMDYIDAISAILEMTYKSTEKSSQEAAVNALYESLSYQINGGLWSDLSICDDFALGKIPLDRLVNSPLIIAKVLSDPNFQIEVYDGRGHSVLSMGTLLGTSTPTEEQLWDFFVDHPRSAMALRNASCANRIDKQGEVYNIATDDLYYSMLKGLNTNNKEAVRDRIMSKMTNHPGFGALLALTVPVKGGRRQQVAADLRTSLVNLIDNLWWYADNLPKENLEANVKSQITDVLMGGESWTAMVDVLGSNEDFNSIQNQLSDYITKLFSSYIGEIQGMNLPSYDGIADDLYFYFHDSSSVNFFFNVYQQLNSAQTSVSTSINGAESQRNKLLSILSENIEDTCESDRYFPPMSPQDFIKNWQDYNGLRIKDSEIYVNASNIDQIYNTAVDAGVNIEIENPAECTANGLNPCRRHMVEDPSTRFNGMSTSTISRYMLIKRSDGTEALNLKRKKSGDDESDRIVKQSIFEILDTYNSMDPRGRVASANTEAKAITALAEYLKMVNESAWYKTLSIYEYENIAKGMILTDFDTGTRYVASLEEIAMLCNEAVYQAKLDADHLLTQNELIAAEMLALSDYGYDSEMNDFDSIPDLVRVTSQQNINTTRRIGDQRMSSPARNSMLVSNLMQKYYRENGDYSGLVTSTSQLDNLDKYLRGDKFEADTEYIPKGYKVTGIVGTKAMRVAIGPNIAWAIPTQENVDVDDIVDGLSIAEQYGINVFIPKRKIDDIIKIIPTEYINNITENQFGDYVIPFFDMRLNGPNTAGQAGAFNVGVFEISEDELVRLVEDPFNTEGLTDAEAVATQGFVDRITVNNSGSYNLSAMDQFPNVIQQAGSVRDIEFDIPRKEDIEHDLIKPITASDQFVPVQIDPGRIIGQDEHMSKSERDAIYRYFERFNETDDRGWLTNVNVNPGDVIGFTRAKYNGMEFWHPVKAFNIDQTFGRSAPEYMKFEYADRERIFGSNTDPTLNLRWYQDGGVQGRSFKFFEDFATNKMMVRDQLPKYMPERKLHNGWNADVYVASFSTASRRVGYQNIQLLSTLFSEARVTNNGYNFAEHPGVFPDNPEIKEAVLNGTMKMSDWKNLGSIRFFPNGYVNADRMNAFMNRMVQNAIAFGINPTHVLASRFNGKPSRKWFNFRVLFYGTPQFKDNCMEFFNFMDSTLCPPNSNTFDGTTLFNNNLQMLVPYTDAKGQPFEAWSYVYTGLHFLDEHYTGFGAPGRTAVANGSQAITITATYGGRYIKPKELANYVDHAFYKYPVDHGMFAIYNENEAE